MKGCFDHPTYWEMIRRLTATHRRLRGYLVLMPALSKLVSDVKGATTLREQMADVKIDFMAGALSGFVLKGALAAGRPFGFKTLR